MYDHPIHHAKNGGRQKGAFAVGEIRPPDEDDESRRIFEDSVNTRFADFKIAVDKITVTWAAEHTVTQESLMAIMFGLPRWIVLCNPLDREACQRWIDESETPGLFELLQSVHMPENVRYVINKNLARTRFTADGETG